MSRVHVVGSINQDIVAEAARYPRPGETLIGTNLRIHPGGKGANQAVAAVRAGARAFLTGCVGDDAAGRELLAVIRDAGVDCDAVRAATDCPTGRGIITIAGGENTIVMIPGANMRVSHDQVARIEFQPGDICVAQLETPVDATVTAFRRAREAGARTLFNPAPAGQVPRELLDLSEILVVNVHEFVAAFDVPVESCTAARLPDSVSSRFQGSLLATRGADGVVMWHGGSRVAIPGHAVIAVDSTGAGDCFVGYLAAGLVSRLSLEQAARRANRAAAIAVTRHGALTSIPLAIEVDACG
ncbi:MAG TPA: ribokinase [Gemmatimonadales bacterium]|nr:ribokinase [Gemmatimonadales bacterium]